MRNLGNNNSLAKRFIAWILAFGIVITSFGVDWNALMTKAAQMDTLDSVPSDGYIAQPIYFSSMHTIDGVYINVGAEVSSSTPASITASAEIYIVNGYESNPTLGQRISGPISGTAILSTTEDTPEIQTDIIPLNFSGVTVNGGETAYVVVKLTNSVNNTVYFFTDSIGEDGLGTGIKSVDGTNWNEATYTNMSVVVREAEDDTGLSGSTINIPSAITLAPGQSYQLEPSIEEGFSRDFVYSLASGSSPNIALSRTGLISVSSDATNSDTATVSVSLSSGTGKGNTIVYVGDASYTGSGVPYAGDSITVGNIADDIVVSVVSGGGIASSTLRTLIGNNKVYASVNGKDVPRGLATIYGVEGTEFEGFIYTIPFSINRADINTITTSSGIFTVNPISLAVTSGEVEDSRGTLYLGRDFTAVATLASKTPGIEYEYTYDITLTGINNWEGSVTVNGYKQETATQNDINNYYTMVIDDDDKILDYGHYSAPNVIIYNRATNERVPDTEFTISKPTPTGVGTYTVTASAINVAYEGVLSDTFVVTRDISDAIVYYGNNEQPTYSTKYEEGRRFEPKITLKFKDGTTLNQDVDFTVNYSKNTSVGTANVFIQAIENLDIASGDLKYYTGSKTGAFKIYNDIKNATFTLAGKHNALKANNYVFDGYSVEYTGNEITLPIKDLVIKLDRNTTLKVDDTASRADFSVVGYRNNTNAGRAEVDIMTSAEYAAQTITLYFNIIPYKLKYEDLDLDLTKMNTDEYHNELTYNGKPLTLDDENGVNKYYKVYVGGTSGLYINPNDADHPEFKNQYKVEYSNNTKAGLGTITVTGLGNNIAADTSVSKTFPIYKKSLASTDELVIRAIPDQSYTGEPIKPTIYVDKKDGNTTVFASDNPGVNPEFEVSYDRNVEKGEALVTVTATDASDYAGKLTAKFNIIPTSLRTGNMEFLLNGNAVTGYENISTTGKLESTYKTEFRGTEIKPNIRVNVIQADGSKVALTQGKDYTLQYIDNVYSVNPDTGLVTKPIVRVKGINGYRVDNTDVDISFIIQPKKIDNLSVVHTELDSNGFAAGIKTRTTDGTPGTVLVNGKDYNVTFYKILEDKTEQQLDGYPNEGGEYKQVFTGINNYSGSYSMVKKVGKNIADLTIDFFDVIRGGASGNTSGDIETSASHGTIYMIDTTGVPLFALKDNSGYYEYGTDYTVTIDPNTNDAGNVVYITFWGASAKLYGKVSRKYSLGKADITASEYNNSFFITMDGQTITGSAINSIPTGAFKLDRTGSSNVTMQVSVTYTPNNKLNGKTTAGSVTVPDVVKGFAFGADVTETKTVTIPNVDLSTSTNGVYRTCELDASKLGDNYTGKITLYYTVADKSITNAECKLKDEDKAVEYTGAAITPKPVVTYKGKTLVEGVDYTLSYTNNTNASKTAKVRITGKSPNFNSDYVELDFEIYKKEFNAADYEIASIKDQEYTSNAITLNPSDIVVKNRIGGTVIDSSNYSVKSQTDNTNPGQATVTVEFKGTNFNNPGEVTGHYNIIADIGKTALFEVAFDTVSQSPAKSSNYGLLLSNGALLKHDKSGSPLTDVIVRDKKYTSTEVNTTIDVSSIKNPGFDQKVKVKAAQQYYTGEIELPIDVFGDLNDVVVVNGNIKTSGTSSYVYYGEKPTFQVRYRTSDGALLVKDRDYKVDEFLKEPVVTSNAGIGAYKYSITPIDSRPLYINPTATPINRTVDVLYNLDEAKITNPPDVPYNGTSQKKSPIVEVLPNNATYKKTLVEGQDYNVAYTSSAGDDCVKVGNITVNISAIPDVSVSSNGRIAVYKITSLSGGTASATLSAPSTDYIGEAIDFKPFVQNVTYNGTRVQPSDYDIRYTTTHTNAGDHPFEVVLNDNYDNATTPLVLKINPISLGDTRITYSTPAAITYTGNKVDPAVEVKYTTTAGKAIILSKGSDYTLSLDSTDYDAGVGKTFTISAKSSNYTGQKTGLTYDITPKDFGQATINNINYVYDGTLKGTGITARLPGVSSPVPTSDLVITFKGDQTVQGASYSDGDAFTGVTNAGTYHLEIKPNSSMVNYAGSKEVDFIIAAKEIPSTNRNNFELTPAANGEFSIDFDINNRDIREDNIRTHVSIKDGGNTLTYGTHYEIEPFTYNEATDSASFTVKGVGNYSGGFTRTFKYGQDIADYISVVKVTGDKFEYDGDEHVIDPTDDTQLKVDSLVYGQHFDVEFPANKTTAGKKYITIKGIPAGGYYGAIVGNDTNKIYYEISEVKISPSDIGRFTQVLNQSTYEYTGSPIVPDISVYDGQILLRDSEYAIEYTGKNKSEPGVVNFRVKLLNYKTTKNNPVYLDQLSFDITGIDFTDKIRVEYPNDNNSFEFTGRIIEPTVFVYYIAPEGERLLVKGRDYTITAEGDKINPGSVEAVIDGIGAYTGKGYTNYNIIANLANAIITPIKDVQSTGSPITNLAVTVQLKNGLLLKQGTDYTVSVDLISGDWNNGQVRATINAIPTNTKYYGSKPTVFRVKSEGGKDPSTPDDPIVKPDNPDDPGTGGGGDGPGGGGGDDVPGGGGGGGGTDTPSTGTSIGNVQISGLMDMAYTGYAITQNGMVLTYNGTPLIQGTDYSLTYVGNIGPGTASVIITGQGKYFGSRRETFNISLPSMSGLRVSGTTGDSVNLTWNAVSNMDGYRIVYTGGGTKQLATVSGNSTGTTIGGLSPNTYYTFEVMPYKLSGSSQIIGNASSVSATTAYSGSNTSGGTNNNNNNNNNNNSGYNSSLPSSVSNLTATATGVRSNTIRWNVAGDGTRYMIYRSTSINGPWERIATTASNTTAIIDTYNLVSGVVYYYYVKPFKVVNGVTTYGSNSYATTVQAR